MHSMKLWSRVMKSSVLLVGLASSIVMLEAAPAAAGVSPKMPLTEWSGTSGGKNNLDVETYTSVIPVPRAGQVSNGHFVSNQFFTEGGEGGYVGFIFLDDVNWPGYNAQINFSWWGAIDVYCSGLVAVKQCGPFDENGGTGRTSQQAFHIEQDHRYQLQIHYGWQDSQGIWWNGYMKDLDTGVLTRLASIKTPLSFGRLQAQLWQWIEWVGGQRSQTCDQIPYIKMWRGNPLWDGVPSSAHVNEIAYPDTPCPASVSDWNGGADQVIGAL